jgi:hypothetical protein
MIGDGNGKKIDRENIEESRCIDSCARADAKRFDAGSRCMAGNAIIKPVYGCTSS